MMQQSKKSNLLLSFISASVLASQVSGQGWPVDGGNVYRQSATSVAISLSGVAPHSTFEWASNAEDTVSEVEFFLLQSPLLTSWGGILVVADNCTVSLLPDPATSKGGSRWIPSIKSWIPGIDLGYEKEFAGIALDSNDVAYILDSRDKALHAVQVTRYGFVELGWSPIIFNYSHLAFDLDVSLLPNSATNQLWVPIKFTLMGNMGIAAQVSTLDGSYTWIPVPNPECGFPEDFGSAVVNGGAVALLGPDTCGLSVVDTTGNFQFRSFPTQRFLFEYSEHSHPVFDPTTQNMYFLDWADSMHDNQFLCCLNTVSGYADCNNWPGQCIKIPELSREEDSTGTWVYRWEWLGAALWQSKGILFVSASAALLDETIVGDVNDLTSAIFAYDVVNGVLLSEHRFNGDQFNSPPLVVTGSSGAGATNVYMSSTLGKIYAYSAPNIGTGPLWVTSDIPGIPFEDLPATTYSYLTVTPSGTLLLTSTAGGADWSDEKAVFAIVNGLLNPSTPDAIVTGLSAGAAVGVTVGVLAVMAALGGFGYTRSLAFRGIVDNGLRVANDLKAKVLSASNGSASSGSSGVRKEGASLLASGTTKPMAISSSASFTGSSGGSGGATASYTEL